MFFHYTIHIQPNSIYNSVVCNSSLNEIVTQPWFVTQSAIYNKIHPSLIIQREIQILVLSDSRPVIIIVHVQQRYTLTVKCDLASPLLCMFPKNSGIKSFSKIQIIASSATIGIFNSIHTTMIQSNHSRSPVVAINLSNYQSDFLCFLYAVCCKMVSDNSLSFQQRPFFDKHQNNLFQDDEPHLRCKMPQNPSALESPTILEVPPYYAKTILSTVSHSASVIS